MHNLPGILTGDDWEDFEVPGVPFLLWYRYTENNVTQNSHEYVPIIIIETNNPHYSDALNHAASSGDQNRIMHQYNKWDYGHDFDDGHGDIFEGRDFWAWKYSGYSPSIGSLAVDPTNRRNCINWALDGFKYQAKSSSWTNLSAASPLFNELTNPQTAQSGDRASDNEKKYHVWVLDTVVNGQASKIMWKDNASQIFTWEPNPHQNAAPKGIQPDGTHPSWDSHIIYRN